MWKGCSNKNKFKFIIDNLCYIKALLGFGNNLFVSYNLKTFTFILLKVYKLTSNKTSQAVKKYAIHFYFKWLDCSTINF